MLDLLLILLFQLGQQQLSHLVTALNIEYLSYFPCRPAGMQYGSQLATQASIYAHIRASVRRPGRLSGRPCRH